MRDTETIKVSTDTANHLPLTVSSAVIDQFGKPDLQSEGPSADSNSNETATRIVRRKVTDAERPFSFSGRYDPNCRNMNIIVMTRVRAKTWRSRTVQAFGPVLSCCVQNQLRILKRILTMHFLTSLWIHREDVWASYTIRSSNVLPLAPSNALAQPIVLSNKLHPYSEASEQSFVNCLPHVTCFPLPTEFERYNTFVIDAPRVNASVP